MKLRFLGRSAAQAEVVDAWWRTHRPGAPDLFARELAGALRLLLRAPGVGVVYGPKSGDGVRRLILQRTGYHVYVHDSEQQVLGILAVWSCRRGRPPSLRLPTGRGGSDR